MLAINRANEPNAVAIGVFYIHFSVAPGLVNGSSINSDALLDEFRVERIDVIHIEAHNAAGNSVSGKGRDVHPRVVTHQPHITGIRFALINAVSEFKAKAQPLAIELFRRNRATNMHHRNRKLEQVSPRYSG